MKQGKVRATRRAGAVLTVFAIGITPAQADSVKLRDGRVYEGTVIEESAAVVRIETTISGIKTVIPIPRRDVREVVIDESTREPGAEVETPEVREPRRASTRDTRTPDPSEGPSESRYMVIPAAGVIGVDVTAPGIRGALEYAERLGATHVIFDIDSPGGYLYEALEIRDVLLENRDRFTLHAYISNQAISAATVLVAGSSTITMAPSSTMGGATAYSIKAETGSAEVDAKINSIWAAQMASIASACGHDEAPFRAMIEQERELYVRGSGDDARMSASPPMANDSSGWECIDDSSTVLTLTARQVEDYGIGRIVEGGAAGLGGLLGVDGWNEAGSDGARSMKKAAKERSQLESALGTAGEQLLELAEDAKTYDPRQVTVVYDRDTLLVTEKSQREWTQASSRASSAWRRVDSLLDRFELLKRKAEDIGALHLAVPQEDIEALRAIAKQQLDWLNRYGKAPRTYADIPPDD